jgi:hypothetical protein
VPEGDQQKAGNADACPADEQHRQVASQHQQGHCGYEQIQVDEEASSGRIVGHVAERVDIHQHGDEAENRQHQRAQRVGQGAERAVG